MSKAKPDKNPTPPNPEERRREAAKRAVMRGARGSIQIANGRFVTPKDKSLDKLNKI